MISERQQLVYKDLVIFERIVLSNNFYRAPKLFKENEACFMFLQSGSISLRTPTNMLTFNKEDMMLAKCGNYYFEKNNTKKSYEENTVAISAYFYPKLVKSFFSEDFTLSEFKNNFDSKKISITPMLHSCIDSIALLFDNPSLASNNLLITKLKELLILISKSEQADSINQFINSLFNPIEYKFEKIIEKNLYSNLTIDEFAHLCGISISTFNRKFKKIYNQSPNQYILSKKLEKATHLLGIETKLISEIAWECGFNSISYFNTIFKKTYLVTPSNFRFTKSAK